MEELISKLAVQAPVAAAMLAGIVWAAKVFISEMGKPAMQRHFEHLDKNEAHMEKQTQALGEINNCLQGVQKQQAEHIQICRTGSFESSVRKPVNGGG